MLLNLVTQELKQLKEMIGKGATHPLQRHPSGVNIANYMTELSSKTTKLGKKPGHSIHSTYTCRKPWVTYSLPGP